MAKVRSETVQTLREFTDFVYEFSRELDVTHWYRGSGDVSYPLLPGLYRHPEKTDVEELLQLEKDLSTWFALRSVPYHTGELEDWDRLFLMQHFRVPTRLLDWTENPFIALYFALTSPHSEPDVQADEEGTPAAVWILSPGQWNAKVFERARRGPFLLSPGEGDPDGLLAGYAPGDVVSKLPVALYGAHNNPRIVAQRGTFVVFGMDPRPMQQVYREEDFPRGVLTRLELPREAVPNLLRSLLAIGITDSVVFPDLEGLAKEARRHFGFEE